MEYSTRKKISKNLLYKWQKKFDCQFGDNTLVQLPKRNLPTFLPRVQSCCVTEKPGYLPISGGKMQTRRSWIRGKALSPSVSLPPDLSWGGSQQVKDFVAQSLKQTLAFWLTLCFSLDHSYKTCTIVGETPTADTDTRSIMFAKGG